MKKLVLASLLAACTAAFAQNAPLEGIAESTDPQKIREVEQRAQEIMSRQQSGASGASDARSGAASASQARERAQARQPGDMPRGQRRDMQRMQRDDGSMPRGQLRGPQRGQPGR